LKRAFASIVIAKDIIKTKISRSTAMPLLSKLLQLILALIIFAVLVVISFVIIEKKTGLGSIGRKHSGGIMMAGYGNQTAAPTPAF